MYLIDPSTPQFKANLHSHSTLSDGKRTPEQLKEMYKNRGYRVLAITDHEYPKSHSDLSDPDFFLLTGYEAHIRPGESAKYDIFAPEIHLNLFPRDPENQTLICHDPRYCFYLERTPNPAVTHAGSREKRVYTVDYVNAFIQSAREAGYLVAYNHPYWSFEEEADIMQYEGLFSLELCNWGSYVLNRIDYAAGLYDRLLRAGKRLFVHAGDDNHNSKPDDHLLFDSFGAFTMLLAPELTHSALFSAMEKGNMYSSMGPTFREVSIEENRVHVECSPVDHIILFDGSKRPMVRQAAPGESLTSADFEVDNRALYVRITAGDAQGRNADTRAFFRDELPF